MAFSPYPPTHSFYDPEIQSYPQAPPPYSSYYYPMQPVASQVYTPSFMPLYYSSGYYQPSYFLPPPPPPGGSYAPMPYYYNPVPFPSYTAPFFTYPPLPHYSPFESQHSGFAPSSYSFPTYAVTSNTFLPIPFPGTSDPSFSSLDINYNPTCTCELCSPNPLPVSNLTYSANEPAHPSAHSTPLFQTNTQPSRPTSPRVMDYFSQNFIPPRFRSASLPSFPSEHFDYYFNNNNATASSSSPSSPSPSPSSSSSLSRCTSLYSFNIFDYMDDNGSPPLSRWSSINSLKELNSSSVISNNTPLPPSSPILLPQTTLSSPSPSPLPTPSTPVNFSTSSNFQTTFPFLPSPSSSVASLVIHQDSPPLTPLLSTTLPFSPHIPPTGMLTPLPSSINSILHLNQVFELHQSMASPPPLINPFNTFSSASTPVSTSTSASPFTSPSISRTSSPLLFSSSRSSSPSPSVEASSTPLFSPISFPILSNEQSDFISNSSPNSLCASPLPLLQNENPDFLINAHSFSPCSSAQLSSRLLLSTPPSPFFGNEQSSHLTTSTSFCSGPSPSLSTISSSFSIISSTPLPVSFNESLENSVSSLLTSLPSTMPLISKLPCIDSKTELDIKDTTPNMLTPLLSSSSNFFIPLLAHSSSLFISIPLHCFDSCFPTFCLRPLTFQSPSMLFSPLRDPTKLQNSSPSTTTTSSSSSSSPSLFNPPLVIRSSPWTSIPLHCFDSSFPTCAPRPLTFQSPSMSLRPRHGAPRVSTSLNTCSFSSSFLHLPDLSPD